MTKLIAIDLDGTLLNNEGNVSSRTMDIISEVQERGHKVIIATGRHTDTAVPIAEKLALPDAIICCNGALITNINAPEKTKSQPYQAQELVDLARVVQQTACEFFTVTEEAFHIDRRYERLSNYFLSRNVHVQPYEDVLQIASPIMKTSIVGEINELDQVENYIRSSVPQLGVIRSGEESIDIMHARASKGAAVKWLAEHYGIDQKNTIALGNYDNDISMLNYAYVGVAMNNAPLHVKATATVVTHSNEEDGVAQFLEEHLLVANVQ